MRIITQTPDPVKMCHARIGDVVQFEKGKSLYLVCARQVTPAQRPARPMMPHGLYDEEREIFLVSLSNGQAYPMPHLSTKLIVRNDVAVVANLPL